MCFFSKPAPPPPLPPVPTPEDPEIKRRREEVRLAALRRRGRASTILTKGSGDTTAAPVARPTLGA
jgi:hypothetical protein